MEEEVSFDIFDPNHFPFGELELEEMLNTYSIYDGPGIYMGHGHTEEDGEASVGGDLLDASFQKCDDSLKSPHNSLMINGSDDAVVARTDEELALFGRSEVIENNFNTTSESVTDLEAMKQSNSMKHANQLLSKLEENDEIVRSFLNEIEGLKTKVTNQDVIINKLSSQVSVLKYEIKKCALEIKVKTLQIGLIRKQNIDVKDETNCDGFNETDSSNCFDDSGGINKNGIVETVLDEALKAKDVENVDTASAVTQHEDLIKFPGNFFQGETKIVDNGDDLMDGGEGSSEFHGSSSTMTCDKFKCSTCHKSFATKTKFNDHNRIHTDERPYPCCICNQAFRQRGNLTDHISRLHKYSVDDNKKVFVRKTGPEGFRCCFCLELMKSRELYQRHVTKVHIDLLPKI